MLIAVLNHELEQARAGGVISLAKDGRLNAGGSRRCLNKLSVVEQVRRIQAHLEVMPLTTVKVFIRLTSTSSRPRPVNALRPALPGLAWAGPEGARIANAVGSKKKWPVSTCPSGNVYVRTWRGSNRRNGPTISGRKRTPAGGHYRNGNRLKEGADAPASRKTLSTETIEKIKGLLVDTDLSIRFT